MGIRELALSEADVYKILIYIGSYNINPLWLTLVIVSLLLLALAQSYASAKKLKLVPALVVSLGILIIGNAITYFLFNALFKEYNDPAYTFEHISIYSYGFMLMISFVIGTIWLIFQGRWEKPKIEADTILDLMVFIIIGSIIGARLIYVVTQWQDYASETRNILKITEGGLSIHGGILGALVFGFVYCKIKGLEYWKMVDFIMPGLALGIFFGRIGCFLNGCCYGSKCDESFPLGVTYPGSEVWLERGMTPDLAVLYNAGLAAAGEYARHPAPLYEAFGALLIFWFLLNFRKNKAFSGHVFLMFIWLYSLLRFFVENFRFGNPDNPDIEKVGSSIVLWNFITVAQLASIILGVVALLLMQDLKRRALLARMLADDGEEPPEEPAGEEYEEEGETDEEAPSDDVFGETIEDDEAAAEGAEDMKYEEDINVEDDDPDAI